MISCGERVTNRGELEEEVLEVRFIRSLISYAAILFVIK